MNVSYYRDLYATAEMSRSDRGLYPGPDPVQAEPDSFKTNLSGLNHGQTGPIGKKCKLSVGSL